MLAKRLQIGTQQPEEPYITRYQNISKRKGGDNMNDNERIASLETKATVLDTKVTNLDTKVTSLDTKVTGLEVKVTGLEVKVTRLEVKVDSIENTLQDMEVDMRELRTDIKNVHTSLNNKIDAGFKWFLGLFITSGVSAFMSIITATLHFIK